MVALISASGRLTVFVGFDRQYGRHWHRFVRITLRYEDDMVQLTYDETLNVVV